MEISELIDLLFDEYQNGIATDEDLIQVIELASQYLVLKTCSNNAKINNKSYNGVNKFERPAVIIDEIKFYKNNN